MQFDAALPMYRATPEPGPGDNTGHASGERPSTQPNGQSRVAVIDGDPAVRDSLATLLTLEDRIVTTYATAVAFLRELDDAPIGCVIAAADLPDRSGLELYTLLLTRHPETHFALLLPRSDTQLLARAQALGIRHVFPKPLVHRSLLAFVLHH